MTGGKNLSIEPQFTYCGQVLALCFEKVLDRLEQAQKIAINMFKIETKSCDLERTGKTLRGEN